MASNDTSSQSTVSPEVVDAIMNTPFIVDNTPSPSTLEYIIMSIIVIISGILIYKYLPRKK